MIEPTLNDWVRLRLIVPKDYVKLVDLCIEFEKLFIHIVKISPYVSGDKIGDIQTLIHRIISVLFGLLAERKTDEKIMKDVKTDIAKSLSRFYDDKGYLKDISSEFMMSRQKGTTDIFTGAFLSPMRTYVMRIYDALSYADERSKDNFKFAFVKDFVEKSGTTGEIGEKKKKGLVEIDEKDEK